MSLFPYMSVYVRWHLIIDACKPRSFWSPSTQSITGVLFCFEAQRSVWSASCRRKKRTQFHLHVTVTLCNIHHRPFFRPYSLSTGAGFSLFFSFFLLLQIAAKDFGTSKTLPHFKTWIPSRLPIPLKLLGKLCTEEETAVELCMQQTVLKSDTGYTTMHTSSLRATATPNRDWIHSGIGWFWVSGTIPNKRGFS